MAVIKITELKPRAEELKKKDMKGIFGGIIIQEGNQWFGSTSYFGTSYDSNPIGAISPDDARTTIFKF